MREFNPLEEPGISAFMAAFTGSAWAAFRQAVGRVVLHPKAPPNPKHGTGVNFPRFVKLLPLPYIDHGSIAPPKKPLPPPTPAKSSLPSRALKGFPLCTFTVLETCHPSSICNGDLIPGSA